ncbi:MAG: urea ABC transporter permease subunit UrtB [Gammaproteobacteria bacterium]|nr:urea ABC transporter permease subunit UrtB [Gammaproteobacteria bacterium]
MLTRFLLLLMLLTLPLAGWADAFGEALELLLERKFADKEQAVPALMVTGDERVRPLLQALLQGELRYRASDRQIYFPRDGKSIAVLSGQALGEIAPSEAKKINLNNRMRSQIKSALAELNLAHADPAKRLQAVNALLGSLDAETIEVLRKRQQSESDESVLEVMALALSIADLGSGDEAKTLAAIAQLEGSLNAQIRGELLRLQQTAESEAVQTAAARALASIQARLDWYATLETLFFGLSLGSVLVLAAIGLAITFGVMGVINMAHGELIMLGAYTTYVVQLLLPNHIGISLFIAIPAAFIVSGLVGILIQRGVIRYLHGRALETLLATFGISLILQQAVRSIFSPLNRSVETPAWMSGSWQVNEVLSLTLNRMYIILFCLLVFALLFWILKRSRLGLQVRAVSQNRAMARSMGVRSEWVDALTFGLGSGIAGIAGVALSQLTNVGPNLGQSYIIDSFMVVVFGGVGNLWGTLVAGLSLGVANKLLEPWSGAVLAKILVLVFIILFIQKRPRGLFPQKGRAAT